MSRQEMMHLPEDALGSESSRARFRYRLWHPRLPVYESQGVRLLFPADSYRQCRDASGFTITGHDPTRRLRQDLVAELIHESICMECRLCDLLVVDEAKPSVKDRIRVSVFLKNIGKGPIRKGVDQTNRFKICLCNECRRQGIVRVIGG